MGRLCDDQGRTPWLRRIGHLEQSHWPPSCQDVVETSRERSDNSKLDIRSASTRAANGDFYFYVDSSAADIPKIEELVRTVVKEPKFWRPPQLKNYFAQHVTDASAPTRIAAKDRPTTVREGSVGHTTHPFFVELPYAKVDGYDAQEQTLESEGFDVLTQPFDAGQK